MNLIKLYDSLIAVCEQRNGKPSNAGSRVTGFEIHHIKPRSMGGADEVANLVYLTPREHYTAHHLLARIYGGGLSFAFWRMSHGKQGATGFNCPVTSRQYATAKQLASAVMMGNTFSSGRPGAMTGRRHTEESKARMSQAHKGRVFSDEHRSKIGDAHRGNSHATGCKRTPERIEQQREINRTRIISDETRAKHAANFSRINKGKPKSKRECPHCSQLIAVNVYSRWHGDNCKHKPADE
ncbi:HNH endonuclease [Salmonella enterica]|nr:HNH endonuclease [Salmonella enterica]